MFSHGSTWKHTHTVKQLVTSTPTASPCSTGLLRFDLFSAPAFWRGFNKTWHGLMLLGVFTALKTVWYEHENDCRNRNGWNIGFELGTTKPTPSHQVSQNTTQRGQQILIGNRYLVGSSGWRSLSWSSTPEDDFQKAVSCQHQRRPGPLSHISSCVGGHTCSWSASRKAASWCRQWTNQATCRTHPRRHVSPLLCIHEYEKSCCCCRLSGALMD